MTRIAMLSMHTSPLTELGVGDGGGLNVYVREISQALAASGAQVDVYTVADGKHSDVIDLSTGLRLHHIDIGPRSGVDKDDMAQLTERFAQGVMESLDAAGGTDVVHAHYWLSGVAGHAIKHEMKIPLATTFHTLSRVKASSGIDVDSADREDQEAKIMACSDAIVVSSQVEAMDLERHYGVTDRSVFVVTPGVDHDIFHPGDKVAARRGLGFDHDGQLLFAAGRIDRIKGFHWALDVVAGLRHDHPDMRLVMVGGPSGRNGERYLRDLELRVTEESLHDNVMFVGPQSRQQLAKWYRAADVSLVPSYSESFGLVAMEAAASGLPVVASDSGGLKFVVQDGVTGLLVRRGDTDGYAHAVDHLFHNPDDARQMGERGVVWARNFTWQAAAQRTDCIYEAISHRVAAPRPLSCLSA